MKTSQFARAAAFAAAASLAPALSGAPSIFTPAAHAQSSGNISVIVDGRVVDFGAVPPSRSGGRVLVPLRAVFEALGVQVGYDPATGTVSGSRAAQNGLPARRVDLTIGSTQASIDGRPTTLDVPAQAPGGRVLVPLRFVSEAFGARVDRITGSIASGQVIFISRAGTGGGTGAPPIDLGGGGNNTPPIVTPPVVNPADAGTVTATVVKADLTPPATLTARVAGRVQTFELAPNALLSRRFSGPLRAGETATFGNTQRVALAQLAPGEEVRLRLDADGNAAQIVAVASVQLVRAAFAQGNRIVLDDANDTVINLTANRRFVDATGQVTAQPDVQAGQQLALFRTPTSGALYQVSALPADIALARALQNGANAGGIDDRTGDNGTGVNGGNTIQLVQHNARGPLKVGSTLNVTVRATPGLRGVFDISNRAQGIPLREGQPGVYTGTYTVRVGDDALNARVTARFTAADGGEERAQSQQSLTIDTVPPRIFGATPNDGEALAGARPNVLLSADDIGGSGVVRAVALFIQGADRQTAGATVSPDGTVSVVANTDLNEGPVTLRVSVFDGAGNSATSTFRYNVAGGAGEGDITALTHNATVPLNAGDIVTVLMAAQPNGRATFDVLTPDGRPVAQRVAMRETDAGRYRGTYVIGDDLRVATLRLVGRFVTAGGQASTLEATQSVRLRAGGNVQLTITTPIADDQVASPLIVRGRAAPGALVELTPRAEGTRTIGGIIGIGQYSEELPAVQARADANGNWTTPAITLPKRPRNVTDFHYVLSAVQRDVDGEPGQPVEVSVTPR